jgi:outer membrane protein, heavy metal efflux system
MIRKTVLSVVGCVVLLGLCSPGRATAADLLSLTDALNRTRDNSPVLAASGFAARIETARLDQAGRRPNPELGVEWDDLGGSGALSGVDASEVTVGITQSFELGGKRSRRVALVQSRVALAEAEHLLTLRDLELSVREAYAEAWAAQSRAALQAELVALNMQLVDQEQARYEAGAASAAMLSRTRAGLAAARAAFNRHEAERKAACNRLAAHWGASSLGCDGLAGVAEVPVDLPADPDVDAVISAGPDHDVWQARLAQQQAAVDVARTLSRPDLAVGIGMRKYNESGDQALVLGAELPLPIFDRQQGEIRAAGYEMEMVHRQAHADGVVRVADLNAALQARRAAWNELNALNREILPEAQNAHEATVDGHVDGRFSLTDVIETRRFLFELRESLIDARAGYHLSDARIQRLLGRDESIRTTTIQEAK